MRRLLITITALITLGLLLLAGPSLAQTGGKAGTSRVITGLDAVSLNAAAGSRTFAVGDNGDVSANPGTMNGYIDLVFWIDYTFANAGTLTLTCTVGPSASDRAYEPTTCSVAAGTCTLNFGGILATPSLSADKKYEARMRILGHRSASCVLAHGGAPGAGDVATIKYSLVGP